MYKKYNETWNKLKHKNVSKCKNEENINSRKKPEYLQEIRYNYDIAFGC